MEEWFDKPGHDGIGIVAGKARTDSTGHLSLAPILHTGTARPCVLVSPRNIPSLTADFPEIMSAADGPLAKHSVEKIQDRVRPDVSLDGRRGQRVGKDEEARKLSEPIRFVGT